MNQLLPQPDEDIGEITLTSWKPPSQMSLERWMEIGSTLQAMYKALPWVIGDWLVAGEIRYGETYTQAIEVTGEDKSVLQNYKWVAHKVPPKNRNPELSWTHHRHVASLPAKEQVQWLTTSDEEGWTTRELGLALLEELSNQPMETDPIVTPHGGPRKPSEPEVVEITQERKDPVELQSRIEMADQAIRQGLDLMSGNQRLCWSLALEYLKMYSVEDSDV